MSEIIITDINKITPTHHNEHEKYEFYHHAVTGQGHGYRENEHNKTVAAFFVIPPGKSICPYHYHTANEEVFYMISGRGVLETPSGDREVNPGDIIICPVGAEGAHRFYNPSETDNLVYLDVDTNIRPEIAVYPHTNKVGLRAQDGLRELYDRGDKVGYYDNEN